MLLHEMAHLVTGLPNGDRDRTHTWQHGHQFCAAYLVLVRHELGVAAHDALRVSMKAHRVRYTPPRSRPMTDEQRAAAAARLAANRRAPSPHRYGLVRKTGDLGPVIGVELSGKRNRSSRRTLSEPYTGPIFAPSRVHDYVHVQREGQMHLDARRGTIDPERAVVRASTEALERWAADPYNYIERDQWVITDLAEHLAPTEAAARLGS